MKLPEIKEANKYTGLYVVDFGDHCGVGFTAGEIAELLESERFAVVYKRSERDYGLIEPELS